jgi:hypothetical protein
MKPFDQNLLAKKKLMMTFSKKKKERLDPPLFETGADSQQGNDQALLNIYYSTTKFNGKMSNSNYSSNRD